MKINLKYSVLFLLIAGFFISSGVHSVYAITITNGMNASDLLGQYSDVDATIPSYTKSTANNAPNALGFSTPMGVLIDSNNHRLYVTDFSNHRVLVFNLDSNNHLVDHIADYVLGQPNFNTNTAGNTQSGINNPRDIALDPTTNRLFVAEYSGNRVKVFDVSSDTLASGMNASYVLGQTDFSGATVGNTQSGLNNPGGVAYDTATNRLFVSESSGNRVKVFDAATSTIANGASATHVIGQADFTSTTAADTQTGLNGPINIAIDPVSSWLYVTDRHRVKIFDVATSTILATSTPATHVIGQADFTSAGAANSQIGMSTPVGVSLDLVHNRLFVSENSNKVKVYDTTILLATSTPAVNVLGQADFTTATATSTQSGLNTVQSTAYDPVSNYLYVVENGGHRVKIFDVASITDGENAVDQVGQYSDAFGTTVSYTKTGLNNSPNAISLALPMSLTIDPVNHRLFVSELTNNRVLVFNLNSDNKLSDKIADYVLGQPDFNSKTASSGQSGMSNPRDMIFDPVTGMLFVANVNTNRVTVFDLSSGITSGMNASYILGQTDFASTTGAHTQSGIIFPYGLAYDSNSKRLFVSEYSGNRIKIFDLSSGITSGMNASYVLGQTDFTSSAAANTQVGLSNPVNIVLDSSTQRLFVSEAGGHRVKVFNVATSTISNGMNAINVLGQADFTTATATSTQSGLNTPFGLAINSSTNQLFVSETEANRIKVFNISTSAISDGMNASYILGQTDFTSSAAADTQSGFSGNIDIEFDETNDYLYVVESNGNRIKIFDLSDPVVAASVTSTPSGPTAVSAPTLSQSEIQRIFGITTPVLPSPSLPPTPPNTTTYPFTRNLTFKARGEDVRQLQIFLNTNGFTVSLVGAGSPGKETAYFGPATRAALIKFQKAKNITPTIGYFGPVTRGVVKNMK